MKHDYTVYSVLRGITASFLFVVALLVFLPFFLIIAAGSLLIVFIQSRNWKEFKETISYGCRAIWEGSGSLVRSAFTLHED